MFTITLFVDVSPAYASPYIRPLPPLAAAVLRAMVVFSKLAVILISFPNP